MLSNQKLFSVGNFDFRLQHLLVIGVLALSISISMLIRSTPMGYGLDLFEFDPFFNFRATDYLVQNGYDSYLNWVDEKSWYPFGRDISENSQIMLHLTTAFSYKLFGFGISLYEFTILFPLVVGSITSIVVFSFVRVLGGTTAGLLAALMFSISVPIFTRGFVGWFKSEPLGLFFGFLAMYLFVSGILNYKGKSSIIKLVLSGLFLSLGLSAWGGILFFIIPILIFFFILPFLKRETNFLIFAIPIFSTSFIIVSTLFERPSDFVIGGYAGVLLTFSSIYVVICEIFKKFSNESNHIRNCSIVLGTMIISVIGVVTTAKINLPGFRYLNAANPFLTTLDPLTDSVSEHATTDLSTSYIFVSVFIIFSMIGIWFLFSRKTINLKTNNRIFTLILGITAFYFSSAFVRLEIFASVGLILLGSIGLALLFKKLFYSNIFPPTKIIFCCVIILLFLIPVTLPENKNWISWADFSPTIYNGGTFYETTNNDWAHAMHWLKNNTPEDSIIASWWDYGYWITTLSDRATIIDNATLIDWQIKKMAYSIMTTPDNSWHILNSHYSEDVSDYISNENLKAWKSIPNDEFQNNYTAQQFFGNPNLIYESGGQKKEEQNNRVLSEDEKNSVDNYIAQNGHIECKAVFKKEAKELGVREESCNPVTKGMDADYMLIFIAAERFSVPGSNGFLYLLDGGADESKKVWLMKISNHEVSKFVESDNMTPTKYFMENSTLGKLMPFSIYKYVEPGTDKIYDEYRHGFIPIYFKDIKYLDSENDPFYLVYASPTFYSDIPGPMTSVLIYKINPDYTS
jgi:dolichyl-diphosphooligosaccharide---protein glycosyltransferase